MHARALATPQNAFTIGTGFAVLAAWLLQGNPAAPRPLFYIAMASALAGAIPILAGALKGLRRRRWNVDELVAIAILAGIVGNEMLAAAVVAFMMNFGSMLERMAERVSDDAVSKLLELAPAVALLKTESGYREVPAESLRIGNVVLVREGDRVPADGVVVTGSASMDQSSITGEALPVGKATGDTVFAGTVSVEGVVEVEATATGESTTISQIVRLVEAAKLRAAPVERLAQRYAKFFTPAVLLLAAVVFAATQDWRRAITVLIVACPCSLVLATPTAVVAAIARAALSGILVRGGDALEALAKITLVAFDKTGTLTTGRPRVEQVVPLGGLQESEVLRLAAGAEMLSSHPLARAVLEYARVHELEPGRPTGFEVVAGRGVTASVSGRQVTVGSHYLLEDPTAPEAARPLARNFRSRGLTCLTVGVDGRPAAMVAVRDTVRAGARSAITALEKEGIRRIVLLTGDSEAVAASIASEAGIVEFRAGLLPEHKLRFIEGFQAAGDRVLMVGDGVNDAPALVRADVGVAIGHGGADIAIESSDLVLLTGDLHKVAEAIRLGKRTLSTIKFNLAFSAVLTVAAFVAAGLGALSPIGAALVHNAGSVFIMMNAALLAARRI